MFSTRHGGIIVIPGVYSTTSITVTPLLGVAIIYLSQYYVNTISKKCHTGSKMKTLPEIREMLKDQNLRRIAERADVHYNTVYRIANGGTSPTYESVRKVVEYMERNQ